MIEKIGPTVYKGDSVYKTGAGGGSVAYFGYVEIAGYRYPITRVGNKLWLAQNLDYYDSDFVKNAASITDQRAQVNYYDNDEAAYGKNGLKLGALYNYPAVELLISKNIFPTGWRVPSLSDVTDLRDKVSSVNSNVARQLFNNPQPSYSSWVPNANSFGFCAIPCGVFNNSYLFKDSFLFIWTTTDYSETQKTLFTMANEEHSPIFTDAYKDRQYSVRLCCDI